MIFKSLIKAALFLLLAILQLSFIKLLPYPLYNLNLALSVLIFMTLLNYKKALLTAFGLGVILDVYSFKGFGLNSIGLFLVVIAVNFLFNNLFTNRSIYSLLSLGSIAIIIFRATHSVLNYLYFKLELTSYLFRFSNLFFKNFMWEMFLNLFLLLIIYYFNRKLNRYYLK